MAGPPNNIPLRAKGYLESGIGLITTLTLTRTLTLTTTLTLTRTLIRTRTLNRALTLTLTLTLPWWSSGKESVFQCRGRGFDPWSGNYDPTCHGATKPVRHNC